MRETKSHGTRLGVMPVIALLTIVGVGATEATQFWVDFAAGNDANSGTSAASAWQHAPGDPAATGNPLSVVLQPGDVVLLRGGVVYRGQIKIAYDGAAGNPITYKGDGWGLEKAVIDGADPVTAVWRRCTSATDCGGNPNWASIWTADIPQHSYSAYGAGLQDEHELLYVAQQPNPSDFFVPDDVDEFWVPDAVTTTTITDARLAAYGASLVGKYVFVWGGNNSVIRRRITAYAANQITFAAIASVYDPGRFALTNHVAFIDTPGEYCYTEEADGSGLHRTYLWPRQADPNGHIAIAQRTYGIDFRRRNDVVIEGFTVMRVSGDDAFSPGGSFGVAIGSVGSAGGVQHSGIVIRNNVVIRNRYGSYSGYGGIELIGGIGCLVEGNIVSTNYYHEGIFLSGGSNNRVRNNYLSRNGGTTVVFYGEQNSVFEGNIVQHGIGSHANGMSLYLSCQNVVVIRNRFYDCNYDITMEESSDLYFVGNVLDGGGETNYVMINWSGMTGKVYLLNNTIVGSYNHFSVNLDEASDIVVKNNVLDGSNLITNRTHNLYVGRSWMQGSGWTPATGELVELDQSKVFVAPAERNHLLSEGSPAVNTGTDVTAWLPTALFPDIDFTVDMSGQQRGADGLWDIGAYERADWTPPPTGFYPIAPCRVLDTRVVSGPGAASPVLAADSRRLFEIVGLCGVPVGTQAISANLTVVGAGTLGDLRVIGAHLLTTNTSALSMPIGRARANNAIVQLAADRSGRIAVANPTAASVHFILDINGYFR